MKIGVIAEDDSDVDVVAILVGKLVDQNTFSISRFVGHGCGKLRRKCSSWAKNLSDRGCSHLIVLHDLDDADELTLRDNLERSISDVRVTHRIVLIPVRELEAWLLFDAKAIKSVFGMKKIPKLPKSPESVDDPKKTLGRIVRKNAGSTYVNTIHNKKIAECLEIESLGMCSSFSEFPTFVLGGKEKKKTKRRVVRRHSRR